MNLPRFARDGTPEVAIAAVMALFMGAACCVLVAFPWAPDAPRAVLASTGVAGLAIAATLAYAGGWITPVRLHVAIVLLTLLRSVLVATAASERGLMLAAVGYAWTAVYVAFFFSPRVARIYAACMIAALGLSLIAARAPADASVWIAVSTMIWVGVTILIALNTRLRAAAHVDGLTGLLNRTGFALAAARGRGMAKRRAESVAVAVIDLDDFKQVNDHGGHAAGDRLLAELAHVWTASLRPEDLLARFGGDEFVLMLPGAEEEQIDALLERLARAHPASWTAGAVLCADGESLEEAIDRADARLYAAKQSRRMASGHEAGATWSWQPSLT